MTLPIRPVLGILADNLRKRGSVLPLSRKKQVGWANGLGLPRGGETVLYTGHVYQLMPAISHLEKSMAFFETSFLRRFFGMGRLLNRAIDLSRLMSREDAEVRAAFDRRLANVACLLRIAGVEFGYLYEKELYSGALAHDLAVDDAFALHAKRVARTFAAEGVRRVITVDPHTTNMLRSVYPEVVPGFDLEVRSYLEVLAEHLPPPSRSLERDVVIHDSCVYARYEDVIDEPRRLLERIGTRVCEPEFSGRRTLCCGGPIESLFPSRARSICAKRMEQLASAGDSIVAMCPICLLNLESAAEGRAIRVVDIADHLAEVYRDRSPTRRETSAAVWEVPT